MKKIITMILIVALALTSVFANGEKEEATQNNVIRFAVWDLQTNGYLTKVKEAFEAANPDLKLEFIDIPSTEYIKKLNVMLNGGSDVDVFLSKDADKTKTFYDRGQLENLKPYIEKAGIDMSVYGGTDANVLYDGGIYGMPVRKDQYVLYYNTDLFDAAGLPYPDNDMTWAEFEELAGKLTSGEGASKKYGAFIHSWQACVQNWGVQDGKYTIMDGNYSIFKPYYEMVMRMQDAGSVMDYATIKSSGIHYSDPFLQGNVAMLPMGSWFIQTVINRIKSGESHINWNVAVLPHPEDCENGYTVGSATPVCINKASTDKDIAWKFVEFLTSDAGATVLAENGQIPAIADQKYTEIFAKADGMPEGIMSGLYAANVSPDRPSMDHVTEIDQMLGQEHSLIMLGELSIDEGLAEMETRFQEIMNK